MRQDEAARGVHAATEAEQRRQQERAERLAAIADETGGMRRAFDALQPLDHNGRRRALRWLAEALDDIEVPF